MRPKLATDKRQINIKLAHIVVSLQLFYWSNSQQQRIRHHVFKDGRLVHEKL